jgi:hypothetical protein
MGPNNPWSPNWRPDESGRRLANIRIAKRGAVLAAVLYLIVAAAVVIPMETGSLEQSLVVAALAIGLPGVALLGAGLAPACIGSIVDGIVVGFALAVGAPVAAVLSIEIGALVVGAIEGVDLAGPILRTSVSAAVAVAPFVAVAAASWVVLVRHDPPVPVPVPASERQGYDRGEAVDDEERPDPADEEGERRESTAGDEQPDRHHDDGDLERR